MGLLKRLYTWLHPVTFDPPVEVDLDTAEHAIQSALDDLREARSNAPKVAELVGRSAYHVDQNHFSELANASFGGSK